MQSVIKSKGTALHMYRYWDFSFGCFLFFLAFDLVSITSAHWSIVSGRLAIPRSRFVLMSFACYWNEVNSNLVSDSVGAFAKYPEQIFVFVLLDSMLPKINCYGFGTVVAYGTSVCPKLAGSEISDT